jgi:hypothetical protein
MATTILLHDRWLYLSAALFLTASAFSVRWAIIDIIRLTKIETAQPLPKPEEITVGGGADNRGDDVPLSESGLQCLYDLSFTHDLIRERSY